MSNFSISNSGGTIPSGTAGTSNTGVVSGQATGWIKSGSTTAMSMGVTPKRQTKFTEHFQVIIRGFNLIPQIGSQRNSEFLEENTEVIGQIKRTVNGVESVTVFIKDDCNGVVMDILNHQLTEQLKTRDTFDLILYYTDANGNFSTSTTLEQCAIVSFGTEVFDRSKSCRPHEPSIVLEIKPFSILIN